jgi:NADPH2:quinone reductase
MLQKVVRSTVIDAPIERVWAVLRDFNSHDQWHGVVEASRIEGGERSDQVGCVRSFTLKDGNRIREQLLGLSDREHRSTYCIVEATVPLQRYVATVTLKPVTDGNRTFWHWESTFATPPGEEQALREMVATQVYEAGFENLRRHLRQGGDLRIGPGPSGRAATATATPLPGALPLPSRRIVVRHYGAADELQPENAECAAPQAGEVRIRQHAIGVNFFDVYLRRGWMPQALPLPGVPGLEAAGTVVDAGEGALGLLPGDRVAYVAAAPGAYTDLRCLPAASVLRLPPGIDETVAAAVLLKGLTADVLLRDLARVRPGLRLLVHAAAGGVGLLLCAWAKRLGAQVIGTVSSEEKARIAREHGCDEVIVTREHRFAQALHGTWPDGAEVIVDGLGEAAREENHAALARCGHWISLGQASGPMAPIAPDWLVQKSLTFSRPVLFDYIASRTALLERAERLWAAIDGGALKLPPIETHALEAAAEAHARLESRRTVGALVLRA